MFQTVFRINVFKDASLEGQMMSLSDYEVLTSDVKEQVYIYVALRAVTTTYIESFQSNHQLDKLRKRVPKIN